MRPQRHTGTEGVAQSPHRPPTLACTKPQKEECRMATMGWLLGRLVVRDLRLRFGDVEGLHRACTRGGFLKHLVTSEL